MNYLKVDATRQRMELTYSTNTHLTQLHSNSDPINIGRDAWSCITVSDDTFGRLDVALRTEIKTLERPRKARKYSQVGLLEI